jgi:error-prone DNA polymerase
MSYTELHITSNFSFLRGGSHPEELADQAALLGYTEIAITDRNTLAGVVRAHTAAKARGIRLIPACRLDLIDGPSLLAYPTDKEAYARLSGLLSFGNLRTVKGQCNLYKADVFAHSEGIKFITIPPDKIDSSFEISDDFLKALREYKYALGKHLYLGAIRSYKANDSKILFRLSELSTQAGVPLIAINDVHYHEPARRELQDVLTCIREKCTIDNAGFKLYQNAERYLKPIKEMKRLFAKYPEAIARTQEIVKACQFSLDELKYVYPEEITSEGRTPFEELTYLAWKGANDFYGQPLPGKVVTAINYELKFVKEMDYAPYFLTVYDIVKFARDQGILCQGRGSAANSTVCFVLGITSVDPTKFELLFERFISSARNEPPDIDVDFEHERREEVIQYIYNKYGRDRAAIVATVTQVHHKGAIRDVAKVMGMSLDAINRLSGSLWEFTDEWFENQRVSEHGFDPKDPHLRKVLELTEQYVGFPRQLGQHTGGFVITRDKITNLCPILNARMKDRTNIEWNKDDIDDLGILKIDVLALGMLTCIQKAFSLCKQHYNLDLTLANIPQDDPVVYEMICHADTIGVFQIESRAQQSMLPRLRPRCFYDLVIEVALVRPGPIQGDMVHPYLRRRNGEEKVTYPSKELEEILGRTLGVPLFQEQAMKIAIVAAGFTPAEADMLRRSMATFKMKGMVSQFQAKLVNGMTARGYTKDFAERVFKQLEGFGSYGFPESHAASFALLVYVSSWIKCYYPDVFCTALLNSQPMGFYAPAQLVSDARKHCVEVRQVDINYSDYDNQMEEESGKYKAVRLGFRQVSGIRAEDMFILMLERGEGYKSINALVDAGVSEATLEKLADADAFRSIGLDRRQALFEVLALKDRPTGMFKGQSAAKSSEQQIQLPQMSLSEHVVHDYSSLALSLKAHPVSFVRNRLSQVGITLTADLAKFKNGMPIRVAGLVLVRQRPGTAGGVCFITIEDETGVANLVVFEKLFDKYRKEILHSRLFMVEGRLQIEGEVIHVIVRRCYDMSVFLRQLTEVGADVQAVQTLARADEQDGYPHHGTHKKVQPRTVVQGEIFPTGRNFK